MVELVTVTEDEAEIRLDRWLRRHFPGLPQSVIQKLCRGGQVRVDGHRADAATRLMAGQSVRVPPLPLASPAAAKPAGEIDPDHIHTPGIFVQRLVHPISFEKRIEQRTVRKRGE